MSIWHHFTGHAEGSHEEILSALGRAGISTHRLDLESPRGPGVLFFDEITPSLREMVREASRSGVERVLAVALGRSELAPAGVWQLLQAGASDVFSWSHSSDPAAEIASRFERWETVDRLLGSPLVQDTIVGRSVAWRSRLRQIVEIARFTDASVLIMGETGTGKELVARLIHTLDPRPRKRDLVILDCTTVVPELSGSEFFGHERGAFTGAVAPREGAFALADGGTLFLDEVGNLPLGLQAQLLRVVQERTYKRVGGNAWHRTDFRLICATNKDLAQEVARGEFRRDFYYRLTSWSCTLPPLRERHQDIPLLVRHFMRQLRPQEDPPELDDAVLEYLLRREYPGNIRDLRQLVSRIVYRHVGKGPITVGDIPEEERPPAERGPTDWADAPLEGLLRKAISQGVGLKGISYAITEMAIQVAIEDEDGNLRRAAQRLGVTDRALQMRRSARRRRRQRPEPAGSADARVG